MNNILVSSSELPRFFLPASQLKKCSLTENLTDERAVRQPDIAYYEIDCGD